MRHDTAILRAAILVDIHNPERRLLLLLVRLDILLPFKLAVAALGADLRGSVVKSVIAFGDNLPRKRGIRIEARS